MRTRQARPLSSGRSLSRMEEEAIIYEDRFKNTCPIKGDTVENCYFTLICVIFYECLSPTADRVGPCLTFLMSTCSVPPPFTHYNYKLSSKTSKMSL